MKQKITSLVVLVIIIATTTFAKGPVPSINPQAINTFSEKFSDAKEVSWKTSDSYIKASFKLHGQVMFAYFTQSGEMVGASRNIVSFQLPIALQTQLRKDVGDGWITEVLEFATDDQTTYFATFENADQKTMVKSSGNSWVAYKKVPKTNP